MKASRLRSNRKKKGKLTNFQNKEKDHKTPARGTSTWVWIAVSSVLLILLLVASKDLFRPKPIAPPNPDLSGLGPMIVESINTARRSVLDSPSSASAWEKLGKTYWVYDLIEAARECLIQARNLNPDDGRLIYFLSLTFLPGDLEGCLSHLTNAVQLLGDQTIAPRLRLAQILSSQGEFDQAKIHFEGILDQDSANPVAQLGLGKIANVLGEFDQAKKWMESCRTSPYTSRAANRMLAGLYLRQGDLDASEEAARLGDEREFDLDWPDPFMAEAGNLKTGRRAWLDGAEDYFRMGQMQKSMPLVELVLKHYPDEPKGYLFKGRIEMAQRRFPQAAEAFRSAIQRDPENIEARVQLGVALIHQKLMTEAEMILLEAVALSPTLTEAHYNLGLCQGSLGKSEEAISAFENAIRFKPDLPDSYIGLAVVLAKGKRYTEAKEALDHALLINPNNSRAASLLETVTRRADSEGSNPKE